MANKRFKLLVATEAEWIAKNPTLKSGEPAYEVVIDGLGAISSSRFKLGDGVTAWNDLPYAAVDVYPYEDLVTVNIGDLIPGDSVFKDTTASILKKIISPFVDPIITSFTTSSSDQVNIEIGTDLSASYPLAWTLSNPENVSTNADGLINCSDVNAFSNLGNVSLHDFLYSLVSTSSYTFNSPQNIFLTLDGIDTNGDSLPQKKINIDWMSYVRYGVNATGEVSTQSHINLIPNTLLTNDIERSYSFLVGYPFILIPSFINTTGIKFIDNDNGLEFSMDLQSVWDNSLPSTVSYNNGNTTYDYKIFRGEFLYNAPTSLTIEF